MSYQLNIIKIQIKIAAIIIMKKIINSYKKEYLSMQIKCNKIKTISFLGLKIILINNNKKYTWTIHKTMNL